MQVTSAVLRVVLVGGVAVCGGCGLSANDYEAKRNELLKRERVILWDDDGCDMSHYPIGSEYLLKEPKTPANFERVMLEATKGTKTDTVCYSGTMGFGYFTFAKAGDMITDRVSDPGSPLVNAASAFKDLGTDALEMAVNYAHRNGQELVYSLRFNDNHDSWCKEGERNVHYSPWKRANSDCLMAQPPKYERKCCGWAAADFGKEKTRAFCRKYVRELLENYDLDGIEYDFFRHPQLFASVAAGGHASERELSLMTQLMCDLRQIAEEVGRRRGRPFLVGMRIPDSVGFCKGIGIDVDAWLKAHVVDFVIVAGYFQFQTWKESAKFVHGYGLPCYASIDESRIRSKRRIPGRDDSTARLARAAAAMAEGMDGVYYFNFEYEKHHIQQKVLRVDPRAADGEDKIYFSVYVGGHPEYYLIDGRRFFTIDGVGPERPRMVGPDEAVSFPFTMADDFRNAATMGKNAAITVLVSADTKDAPRVKVNGKDLSAAAEKDGVYEYPADSSVFVRGTNAIKIASGADMTLHDFAVRVRFK